MQNERDISVRQRAVDLLYAMCDHSNAVPIVTELLEYLKSKADYSIREELVGGGAREGQGRGKGGVGEGLEEVGREIRWKRRGAVGSGTCTAGCLL